MTPDTVLDRLTTALADRYRIERELGAGGMATVYLAEDVRHGRKVALKVLKPELAAVVGAERFLAEIRTTASLQHPHILPLHDSGEADSFLFYVMPYIEGETLQERLEREQQLPVEEALTIAAKVAAALQYAHEQGVVHRDIKPANILMSRGEAMVADFGIALAVSQAGGGRITETGLSLGTPHYMSPEQATGERTLDKRSDVYALGCVLYEMLTGQPPFGGPTAQAVLGRILTGDPDPVTAHRRSVPPHVEAAVHKALERLPADRFDSAREFAAALGNPSFRAGAGRNGRSGTAGPGRWRLVAGISALAALIAAGLAGWAVAPGDPPPVRRYHMELPGHSMGSVVGRRIDISPDGSMLAYTAVDESGTSAIWLRPRDQLQARAIPGTATAGMPTFSPDSRRIAFGSGNSNLAVATLGGEPPVTFAAPGNQTYGLAWGSDDMLYYAGPEGIVRIPAGGGTPEQVTAVDTAGGELLHVFPSVLPGARALIYTAITGTGTDLDAASVVVMDLSSREIRTRLRGIMGRYAASGHLLTISNGDFRLLAAPFDLSRLEVTGDPVVLAQSVSATINGFDVALSDEGTLVYRPGAADAMGSMTPVLVRRDGAESVADGDWRGNFTSLAVSPSGDRLAASTVGPDGEHIWVKELGGAPPGKRTFNGQANQRPAWTRDGRHLIFYSNRLGGAINLWRVPADGSGPARKFLDDRRDVVAAELSPDGAWLVYRTNALQAPGADILARRLDADGQPQGDPIPLMTTPAGERSPTFSPDGRWLAYVSDESGRDEIYVRPFPNVDAARWQVSVEGANEPLWSRGGGEIFYRSGNGDLVAVSVRTDPTFAPGARRALFPAGGYSIDYNHRSYDVLPGDSVFVMIAMTRHGGTHLVVVDNLFTELRRRGSR
jgi:eukaryotic-like serine/threonine-protein kinase